MQNILIDQISLEEFEKLQKIWIKEALEEVLDSRSNQSKSNEEDYVTRQEASSLLKISLPTLNKLTKSGKIPASRIGTRVLYKRSDIIASLDKIEPIQNRRAQ